MKKIFRNNDILLLQPLCTKKRYFISKIIVFVGIIFCLLIFILAIYYWNSLTWYIKVLMAFLIMLLSPDIEDVKFLIKSYDSYHEEWIQNNSGKEKLEGQ